MTDALWQLGGWTMIHFLWLGTAVALLGATLRFACRRAAPGMRYAMSLLTLAALTALPLAIAAWLSLHSPAILNPVTPRYSERSGSPLKSALASSPSQDGSSIDSQPRVIDLAITPVEPAAPRAILHAANPSPSPSSPRPLDDLPGRGLTLATVVASLPWLWLIGAPLTFALLASGLIGSERLRRKCTPLTTGPAAAACEQLRQAMRITRRVSIAVCDSLAQPVLIGILRPLILLPASALSGWTPAELEMVLVHELAHVRRWDNLINLLQRIIESALFFHPAVWLVSRQVRRDREECCDAVVVSRIERPHDYAALLVSIAAKMQARRPAALAAASAMADHPLTGRVRRILKLEDEPMGISRRTLSLTIVVPLLLAAAVIYSGAAAENPPPSKGGARVGIEPGNDTASPSIVDPNKDDHPKGWNVRMPPSPEPEIKTARSTPDDLYSNVELPRIRAEIKRLEGLIAKTNSDLVDLELFKQSAVEKARSPAVVEKAIAEVLENDPMIANYQQKVLQLQSVVQSHEARYRNSDDLELTKLVKRLQQTEQALQQYRASAEKAAREQIAKMPNEAFRAAIVEHKIRYQAATANLKKYTDELDEANRKLNELIRSSFANKEADDPIYPNVYPVADVETIDFQRWMQLISSDPRIDVRWFEKNKSLVVNAPRIGHKQISELFSETRDKSGDPGVEERVRDSSDENPFDNAITRRNAPRASEDNPLPMIHDRMTGQHRPAKEPWEVAFDAAQRATDKNGKFILVHFYSPNSKPCAEFEERVLNDPEVRAAIERDYELMKVNVDESPTLAANYRIKSIPAAAIIGSNATTSFVCDDRDSYLQMLKTFREKSKESPAERTAPSPLAPGDDVKIRVVGAFPEWPLDEVFRIEEEGTLALGPAYGRVSVAGQTVAEAEKTLISHLSKILSDVEVQLTLYQRAANAPPNRSDGKAVYLYDGKTFDEWRSLWKHELNTERRTEAIEALAAFARAGYGKQAAETILDVAGEYEFKTYDESPEGKLRERVAQVLTLGRASRVPATDWLPALMDRHAKDPDKWRPLMTMLIGGGGVEQDYSLDPAIRKLLLQIANDPTYGPNAAVLRALYSRSFTDKGEPVSDPEVAPLIEAALAGEDLANALAVLRMLSFGQLDQWPQQLDFLFHENTAASRTARSILQWCSPQAKQAVAERMESLLNDPNRAEDHANAIRALGAMLQAKRSAGGSFKGWPDAEAEKRIIERFVQITREGAPQLVAPGLVAMGIKGVDEIDDAIKNGMSGESEEYQERIKEARDKIEAELEQLVDPPNLGGGLGGGGIGGAGARGGGMF